MKIPLLPVAVVYRRPRDHRLAVPLTITGPATAPAPAAIAPTCLYGRNK
ncbi:hypothetical protein [Methanoregula sp.]|jgi:hypothetical protein